VAAGNGSLTSSSLQWAGESTRPKTIVAETMGLGTVGHFASRPPSLSLAANWSNDNYLETDVIFSFDANQGDIWEIDVVAVLQNTVTAQFTATSITTTTTIATGKIFCPTLDHDSSQAMTALGRAACL